MLKRQSFTFAKSSSDRSPAFALSILFLLAPLSRGGEPEKPTEPKENTAAATPPSGAEVEFDRAKASELANVEFRKTIKHYNQAFQDLVAVLNEVPRIDTFASQLAFNAQRSNLEKAMDKLGATERFFENPGAAYRRTLGTNHWDARTLETVGRQVNEQYAASGEAVSLFAQMRVQCRAAQGLMEFARTHPGGWAVSADHRQISFIDGETQRAYNRLDKEINDGQKLLQELIHRWEAVAWKGGSSATNAAPKPRKRLLH